MKEVFVSVYAQTDVGMLRSGNEDAFLVADLSTGKAGLGPEIRDHKIGERGTVLVVSDGMGGAAAGEIASELAVTSIEDALLNLPLETEAAERLSLATQMANERIWEHAQQNPELSGMGATITAVLIYNETAYIGQVGDSRAYLIRGEQAKQLTKDQSLAQMLLDAGAITPEQAAAVPQNVIMQALGTQPAVTVVLTSVELCRNDYLVVCSDGLSNKIDAYEMREVVQQASDLERACRRLVEIANERGGEDNITVIVARFDGTALCEATINSSISDSFKSLNEDYINENAAGISRRFAPPSPKAEDNLGITQALFLPQTDTETDEYVLDAAEIEAAQVGAAELHAVEVDTGAGEDDDTADTLREQEPDTRAPRRQDYRWVFILGLISLLLLVAAGFFFYRYYSRARVEEQPPVGALRLNSPLIDPQPLFLTPEN
ncbi:MAG TPA: Stp1/IreP family PP2C-type Ser/Thr phosphatase [Blastocatellia bacterium]|nr:Stp1/IreP family PP2C-type Ser/Thr phosphatase [Blastocatellia bacterium]